MITEQEILKFCAINQICIFDAFISKVKALIAENESLKKELAEKKPIECDLCASTSEDYPINECSQCGNKVCPDCSVKCEHCGELVCDKCLIKEDGLFFCTQECADDAEQSYQDWEAHKASHVPHLM